ncbi:MAG TPA: transcription termination factor Rho [Deltaproteobacteria bacterium]|nr:transcription termination factor Rho [Deltaproteobacteria bacterium]HPP81478.1 transcription termination factor Rho [Deltaproteobacteria bacterium]
MSEKKPHKDEKPLERMTVKELREIALEIPHEHTEIAVRDMNKEQLVAFIKQARGIHDEPAAPHPKKKAKAKVILTKQEVKARIRDLKKKAKASGGDDPKRASILRRRISRLKKLSRKLA